MRGLSFLAAGAPHIHSVRYGCVLLNLTYPQREVMTALTLSSLPKSHRILNLALRSSDALTNIRGGVQTQEF